MPITLNGTTGVVTPGATIGSINGILKSSSGVVSQAVAGTDYLTSATLESSPATAKAWVNFNGTLAGPITPEAAYNFGVVTKNGTGDYTLTFLNPMSDTNYILMGFANSLTTTKDTGGPDGRDEFGIYYAAVGSSVTPTPALKTTSQVRCVAVSTSTNFDGQALYAIVYGN